MEIYLPNFGRSSHNIGKIIRTSQACGTKSTQSKYQHQQKSSNMDNKFRNQLLAESKQKEEELKGVNLEIEERAVSKKGPDIVTGKEFDTKEDAEKHLSKKAWDDILTAALIFIAHVNNQTINTQKE